MRIIIIILFLFSNAHAQVQINGTGTTIKINGTGTTLPINRLSNEVEVYILSGQSNVGRARVSEMTAGEQNDYAGLVSNAYVLNPYLSETDVYPLEIGVNTMLDNAVNTDEFGCEAALFASFPTGVERYLLKYGVGGTSMQAYWSALANRVGWLNLKQYTRNLVTEILSQGKTPVLKSFIWVQGESDAASESFANNYGWRLQGCRDDFAELWDSILTANALPAQEYEWIVGRIKLTDALYDDTLRANQANFCNDINNNATLIDTDGYPLRDTSHYSATGQIQFGLDIYTALQNGIFLVLLFPKRNRL